MKKQTNHIELMAPAGSFESLNAAIKAGADAIYFGVDHLNMRARAAKPFAINDIATVTEICQKHQIKSYLTLNTILYDEDIETADTLCQKAADAGISAIIASDMAAIQLATKHQLSVHISTQANISNIEAVRFYARFADVLVLARELTLNQIEQITAAIREQHITGPSGDLVRIELFIHGALCVAISGKCYMSLALNNHSANRGDCFQICRRSYQVTDAQTGDRLDIDNQYVMSPKDLCTIRFMDQLIESGAAIFKIEGRGRAPEYVYHTTKVYREAIAACQNETYSEDKFEAWEKELHSVFNRGFWHGGYYLGHPLGEWAASYGSQATRKKRYVGSVLNYYPKSGIAHIAIQDTPIKTGDTLAILGKTTGFLEFTADEIRLDEKSISKAKKGDKATIPVPDKVRRNDKIYVYCKLSDTDQYLVNYKLSNI